MYEPKSTYSQEQRELLERTLSSYDRNVQDMYERLERAAFVIRRGKKDADTLVRMARDYGLERELMRAEVMGKIVDGTFSRL
jgi:predicted DsbA family dithiol-disulfide isomerase